LQDESTLESVGALSDRHEPTKLPADHDLLSTFMDRTRLNTTQEDVRVSELIYLLDEMGCPEGAFQSIILWCRRHYEDGFDFNPSRTTRAANMKRFVDILLDSRAPVAVPHSNVVEVDGKNGIENHQVQIPVVHFDFNMQLLSLLGNEDLMRPENLVVDTEDPFGPPPQKKDNEMFESHHARRYHHVREVILCDAKTEVLLPIILYVDKTHIDRAGRFTLEPVTTGD